MTDVTSTRVHHVVFCVYPENHSAAVAYWRDLGLTFGEPALPETGLRVSVDLAAGVEIISPIDTSGTEAPRFQEFLDSHGEGIWSVVVRVPAIEGPTQAAQHHGATVRHNHRGAYGASFYDESDMSPVFGMPVTLLATNHFE